VIKYGLDTMTELAFKSFTFQIERRDGQWIDIYLQPELKDETPAPDDMVSFTIWVICLSDGTIVQILPQDEGCDCEYSFTVSEKEQIVAFVNIDEVQVALNNLA
jgi:hypothetical protein